MAGDRKNPRHGNRNYRAKVKELVEELEASLEYPKRPGILIIGPDNVTEWEVRDELHNIGADELPEVKSIDREIVDEAVTWGGVWYNPPEERTSKPLSYWWWWLDKIIEGELSKELLPEHVRDLIS